MMDAAMLRQAGIIIVSILCAYLLADVLANALLRILHLSGAAGAVAGLIVFGILFFSILQGIERLTGTGIFRFGWR
jgi:hypothetical protein